jgi:4-hydroxybenzoate polyprenyltransferase
MSPAIFRQLRVTLEMIKIEHTVFALPFAFLGALLAGRQFPGLWTCAWVLVAMIGARSAAMAFNRLVDMPFDRENPRTRDRSLPQGRVSRRYVVGFTVASALLFLFAAYMLNLLTFVLAFPALGVVLGYSLTKRFTSLTHAVLGFALSIAPAGGWIAVTGSFDVRILVLSLVVVTWVAGFDILYACQDVGFDSRFGLYSIPVRFGVRRALAISFGLHLGTILSLGVLLYVFQLSWFSLAGTVLLAAILVYEHLILHPQDLTRVNTAFFTLNGIFSILLFIFVYLDLRFFRTPLIPIH